MVSSSVGFIIQYSGWGLVDFVSSCIQPLGCLWKEQEQGRAQPARLLSLVASIPVPATVSLALPCQRVSVIRECGCREGHAESILHIGGINSTLKENVIDDITHATDKCLCEEATSWVVKDPAAVMPVRLEREHCVVIGGWFLFSFE